MTPKQAARLWMLACKSESFEDGVILLSDRGHTPWVRFYDERPEELEAIILFLEAWTAAFKEYAKR